VGSEPAEVDVVVAVTVLVAGVGLMVLLSTQTRSLTFKFNWVQNKSVFNLYKVATSLYPAAVAIPTQVELD
jgi:hypothetical protein